MLKPTSHQVYESKPSNINSQKTSNYGIENSRPKDATYVNSNAFPHQPRTAPPSQPVTKRDTKQIPRSYPVVELEQTQVPHNYKAQVRMQDAYTGAKYFNSGNAMGRLPSAQVNPAGKGSRNDDALLNCILDMKPPPVSNGNNTRQPQPAAAFNNYDNFNQRRITSFNTAKPNSYQHEPHRIKQVNYFYHLKVILCKSGQHVECFEHL